MVQQATPDLIFGAAPSQGELHVLFQDGAGNPQQGLISFPFLSGVNQVQVGDQLVCAGLPAGPVYFEWSATTGGTGTGQVVLPDSLADGIAGVLVISVP